MARWEGKPYLSLWIEEPYKTDPEICGYTDHYYCVIQTGKLVDGYVGGHGDRYQAKVNEHLYLFPDGLWKRGNGNQYFKTKEEILNLCPDAEDRGVDDYDDNEPYSDPVFSNLGSSL